MKNFDRGSKRNFGGGGGGYEKRDFGGSRGFAEKKEMFPAICSECGNHCEVPFRPSGSKPVFCSDCFRGHDAPAPRSGGRDRDREFSPSRSFQERPERASFTPSVKDNMEERLAAIHNKLDKIMAMLSSNSNVTKAVKEDKVKEEVKKEIDEKPKAKVVVEKKEKAKAVKKVAAPKKKDKVAVKKVAKK